jgi:hypothetical protein
VDLALQQALLEFAVLRAIHATALQGLASSVLKRVISKDLPALRPRLALDGVRH